MTRLIAGLSLGLAAGLVPGPLQALVVTTAISREFGPAWRVAIAPLLTDPPIIVLSLVVLSRIPGGMVAVLGVAGGAALLAIAATTARDALTGEQQVEDGGHVRRGVLINLLSPHPWLFWVAAGGPLLLGAWRRSPATAAAFLAAFYAMLVGSKVALAWVVARAGRSLGDTPRRRLTIGGASILAVAGAVLIVEAVTGRLS